MGCCSLTRQVGLKNSRVQTQQYTYRPYTARIADNKIYRVDQSLWLSLQPNPAEALPLAVFPPAFPEV